ncbi:hypothetical protein CONPUDRAFT_79328 [Coniophora puteana RWD-64-598 SS2]|uniref:Uncharacterized protein n=1 Tax=Coniophora puteana (strain RWD-64-598) TaxID=741705 RepID=A0A5M3N8I6_CONPW|nr:uncharacterized protein CONPUDRAFT_79328 [Coniophora puteana RWD-64-598 SS2]EIW87171.1 hypothetical protein CONPUDRAFT_79328 [Coniophora puteana RWD-64-598 SS2]
MVLPWYPHAKDVETPTSVSHLAKQTDDIGGIDQHVCDTTSGDACSRRPKDIRKISAGWTSVLMGIPAEIRAVSGA